MLVEQMAGLREWSKDEMLLAEARLRSALWDEQGQSARLAALEAAVSSLAPIGTVAALTALETGEARLVERVGALAAAQEQGAVKVPSMQ